MPPTLNLQEIEAIESALDDGDIGEFIDLIGLHTPRQLAHYQRSDRCHEDWAVTLWGSAPVSWAFEIYWADLAQSTPEELEQAVREGGDIAIPANTTHDEPLLKHSLWAIQDFGRAA
jgi:hypothetical protein